MAFFKFRKGGDDQTTTAPPPESIEAMRKRAKHRLIGAAVLVLIGVIGFPLLVDKQPRPIAVDIPIEIPDKNKTLPLAPPAVPPVAAPAAAPSTVAAGKVGDAPVSKAAPLVEPKADKPAAPAPAAPAPAVKPEAKPESKPADKAAEPPAADSGAKAQALLEGKEAPKEVAKEVAKEPAKPEAASAEDRYVVQVGAYADVTKAREARLKVERAGLKTYTQVVETKEGKRIRVRVGPFATKAQADAAAEKIKKLDLPTAILTL